VEKKLGLQKILAPPIPNTLDRFELLRLLWNLAPDKAKALSFKPAEGLTGLNGRSLEELVRVEKKLFVHPDDA
jgi:hypothetical protein